LERFKSGFELYNARTLTILKERVFLTKVALKDEYNLEGSISNSSVSKRLTNSA